MAEPAARADISPLGEKLAAQRPGGNGADGLPDGLVWSDSWGAPIILVPSEHVLLLPAELPLAGARQRAEALPFALEARLGAPLETLHVVLGQPLGGAHYLGAAVNHDLIQRWIDALETAGFGELPLVPDATTLPVPPLGWLTSRSGERILVRADDGSGFAAPADMIEALWEAAGRPQVEAADGGIPANLNPREADLAQYPAPALLDLRTGAYAARRSSILPWRKLALVASAGLVAHFLILAADTAAMAAMADARRAQVEQAWADAAPGMPVPQDLAATVTRRLAVLGTQADGAFLPLLSEMSAALLPLAEDVTISEMRFDGADGALIVTLETGDFAGLQAVRTAFADAGLRPVGGTARATPGGAEIAFTIAGDAG